MPPVDEVVIFVMAFVFFALSAICGIMYAAMMFWRRDAKASHQQCMTAWMRLDAEQSLRARLTQERDSLVLQMDRMTRRISELKEGAHILGMLASDQLDRMKSEAETTAQAEASENANLEGSHADAAG
jgi:hypothetical protein